MEKGVGPQAATEMADASMSLRLPFPAARARILGSGAAFPSCWAPDGTRIDRIETGWLLAQLTPELPDERRQGVLAHLEGNLGVGYRSWSRFMGVPPQEAEEDSATLGIAAARAALRDAGVPAQALGFIVFATSTPPRWTSPMSARVAGVLEARCGFFDVRSGCASGLYALAIGSFLAAASQRPVLVIGSDTFSKTVSRAERLLALSIGDGAGALVLGPAEGEVGMLGAFFGGDGSLHNAVTVPAALPPQTFEPAAWHLCGEPERFAAAAEKALGLALCDAVACAPEKPQLHLVHAGQRSICQRVSTAAGGAARLWLETLAQHGNLGAASIAVALHETRRAGVLHPGTVAALASVGGGVSWGGLIWSAS